VLSVSGVSGGLNAAPHPPVGVSAGAGAVGGGVGERDVAAAAGGGPGGFPVPLPLRGAGPPEADFGVEAGSPPIVERDDLPVLHLLYLALPSHLLLDLGVAAARTCPGDELATLQNDFNKINDVVGDLIRDFHRALGHASPVLGKFDEYLGFTWSSSSIVGLKVARSMAWSAAERLAKVPEHEQEPIVREIDERAAEIGRTIAEPIAPLKFLMEQIRERESNDPAQIIALLLN